MDAASELTPHWVATSPTGKYAAQPVLILLDLLLLP